MRFIQKLSLNFHSFLDLHLNGSMGVAHQLTINWWYRINTSYSVENLQLSFCLSSLSIKSTHEFKWYTQTLWPNGMKILG